MRLTRVASDNYQRITRWSAASARARRELRTGRRARRHPSPRSPGGVRAHHLPSASEVPWQRVLNAAGEVAKRAYPEDARWQRDLLEEEGVEFDARGRVLPRFFWKPKRRD